MESADFSKPAAERRQNLYACHSCAQYSSYIMLFHAYPVSAKLHMVWTFYSILLIMPADAAMACVMQLVGNNLMALNRVAQ
jgi:hypothetical protein